MPTREASVRTVRGRLSSGIKVVVAAACLGGTLLTVPVTTVAASTATTGDAWPAYVICDNLSNRVTVTGFADALPGLNAETIPFRVWVRNRDTGAWTHYEWWDIDYQHVTATWDSAVQDYIYTVSPYGQTSAQLPLLPAGRYDVWTEYWWYNGSAWHMKQIQTTSFDQRINDANVTRSYCSVHVNQ